jgi:L,D-peptidoglycan transpeptidase YkuD (ErfK/YbiS/YcfS/YnhG family)
MSVPVRAENSEVLNIKESLIGDARQVVVVENTRKESTSATLSIYAKGEQGWRKQMASIAVRIGRNGFSADRREGDGTTPMGSFRIQSVFGIVPVPSTGYPYIRLKENYCWVLRSSQKTYNSLVKGSPCMRGDENLFRIAKSGPYRRSIVLDFNMNPVIRGHGGAIFIHSHSYDGAGNTKPTSGCVSLTNGQLVKLLKLLDASLQTRVVMGTKSFLAA